MTVTQEETFGRELATAPWDELLDRVVDTFVQFNLTHPGFHALFAATAVLSNLSRATRQLHEPVIGQVEAMLATRIPHIPQAQRERHAQVSVEIFHALLPLILSSKGAERRGLVEEN